MDSATKAAIETIVTGLETAWNNAEGQAFAARFAPDADFVNVYGLHAQRREAIAHGHEMILSTVYRGSRVRYELTHARYLNDRVALIHVRATLDVPEGPMAGRYLALPSAVLTRPNTHTLDWEIAAFHNTFITNPPGRPEGT